MADGAWKPHGPWRLLIAPGWDRAGFAETLAQLPYWIEKQATPLVAPGRHRVDRLLLPCGSESCEVVVKTYAGQSAARDRWAAQNGTKAERAFRNALRLRAAGVGTPAPIAVAERWEGARLRESRFVAAYVPDLTNLRDELNRIYREAPFCAPLMALLQQVADAIRALHDEERDPLIAILHGVELCPTIGKRGRRKSDLALFRRQLHRLGTECRRSGGGSCSRGGCVNRRRCNLRRRGAWAAGSQRGREGQQNNGSHQE